MDAKLANLKAANAAARDIRVYAKDLLRAHGGQVTSEHRAILARQADALRAFMETSEPQTIRVNVFDIYNQDVKIGELHFEL